MKCENVEEDPSKYTLVQDTTEGFEVPLDLDTLRVKTSGAEYHNFLSLCS
jgi:hypothetical protein